MGRLTKRYKGNDGYYMKCVMKCRENACNEYECEKFEEFVNRMGKIEDILGDDYDLNRLRELVEAEQEGRCFITPCKLGTKIKTKNGEETVNCFIIGQTRSGEIRMFGPGKANITGDFDEDFPDDDMKSAEIWYVRIDEE